MTSGFLLASGSLMWGTPPRLSSYSIGPPSEGDQGGAVRLGKGHGNVHGAALGPAGDQSRQNLQDDRPAGFLPRKPRC